MTPAIPLFGPNRIDIERTIVTPARNTTNSAGHVRTVALDLDALERDDDPGPFTFKLRGREYKMIDPQASDYRDLAPVMSALLRGDLVAGLSGLLDPDDVEEFWANRVPAFKLNALGEGWLDHYGLRASEKR